MGYYNRQTGMEGKQIFCPNIIHKIKYRNVLEKVYDHKKKFKKQV